MRRKKFRQTTFSGKADAAARGGFVTVLLIYCVSMLVPLAWMLLTAFKKDFAEILENPFGFPRHFNFDNFAYVFKMLRVERIRPQGGFIVYSIWDMVFFSFAWAAGNTAFSLLITALVAYVIAKYKFFGRNFLYSLGIFIMITPIIGTLPAAMQFKKALGIYDNMILTILTGPSAAFSGLTFLLMHAAFKVIPWSYAEAAFIDGAGHFTVLARIMLPMVLPTVTVLFVLGFLGSWNDYMTFVIWLPSYPNLALGMYEFQQNTELYKGDLPQIMAGFTLIIIPTAALYIASQRLILSKFTVGGLKG